MPTTVTPQFSIGDRVFSHYVMDWGTIEAIDRQYPAGTHGLTGEPLPATTWYSVRMDKSGRVESLDDGSGNWDMARIIPPNIASRYGYGTDPKKGT